MFSELHFINRKYILCLLKYFRSHKGKICYKLPRHLCIHNIGAWDVTVDAGNVDQCKPRRYTCVWSEKWMCYCNNDDTELPYSDTKGSLYVRKNRHDMSLDAETVFEIQNHESDDPRWNYIPTWYVFTPPFIHVFWLR